MPNPLPGGRGQDQPTPSFAELLTQSFPNISARDVKAYEESCLTPEQHVPDADTRLRPGVPKGALATFSHTSTGCYPGITRSWSIYTPHGPIPEDGYALMVFQDGGKYLGPDVQATVVLDNLLHDGRIPHMVALFVDSGSPGPGIPLFGGNTNRSVEYDSTDDRYASFLEQELLPEVQEIVPLRQGPRWRAICGMSSGGLCAFVAAWQRPDLFSKVVSHCGSFVNIRGGHEVADWIRRSPAKDLRVFLQSGTRDLRTIHGDWLLANRQIASALAYRGYEHSFVVGNGGHTLKHGAAILPATLRWLWR